MEENRKAKLDEKFKNTSNKYEISMNQLEQNVQKSQTELMKHFKLDNEFGSDETIELEYAYRPIQFEKIATLEVKESNSNSIKKPTSLPAIS